ncbi:tRNA uridine-5-carboxymethylaminomethyl(34) synthesis GTPase MnmE [Gammaproteobacteria bacterium 42_54_T18]|nr:tRNA uridine-5-carboxymethylaminomethyl(34) synthesis GTPase MnmE [Gammaproteobacteria bacterium 42_54_T18]
MNDVLHSTDTIAAQATPAGRGGVGIIRISGKKSSDIALQLIQQQKTFKPRFAHFHQFLDSNQEVIDEGLILFFPGPNSFTGEDVIELQGHGGPVVINSLLNRVLNLGARMANPGEFSERAFLNDKLDLAQAEAIADLIDSSSEQAARCAIRSLNGAFSDHINVLVEQVINLRLYVEAAIDFPEEEIDFLADGKVAGDLQSIIDQLDAVFKEANRGVLLKEGMKVVLAGRPNAGKSSLLNALAGRDTAIVTDIAGTTRDLLREHIHIDGMPLHIIDTAGLRESPDAIEKEGIRRAWTEIKEADRVLLLVDAADVQEGDINTLWPEFFAELPDLSKVIVVRNKIDKTDETHGVSEPCLSNTVNDPNDDFSTTSSTEFPTIRLSAKHGEGVDELREYLKNVMGYQSAMEGGFTARQRHLEALKQAKFYLVVGQTQLIENGAGELLAEDLRMSQNNLSEITGEFTPDDLLGRIFSSFCIGK